MEKRPDLKKILDNDGLSPQSVLDNPAQSSVISKLIHSRVRPPSPRSEPGQGVNPINLANISQETAKRRKDAELLFKLFPDLELSAQIIVSGIISPQDALKPELVYKLQENTLPPAVTNSITSIVKNTLTNKYLLEKELPIYFREALFDYGAHIRLIIPENSIDSIINNSSGGDKISLESLKGSLIDDNNAYIHMGFLGNPTESNGVKTGLESFGTERPVQYDSTLLKGFAGIRAIEVYDNFNLLRLPELIQRNNQVKVKDVLHQSMADQEQPTQENFSGDFAFNDRSQDIYKKNMGNMKPIISVPISSMNKRKSIGRPLIMKIPTEAVIPVHVPSDPENHIGYFILIDAEGHPLNTDTLYKDQMALSGRLSGISNDQGITSYLQEKASSNLLAKSCDVSNMNNLPEIYSDLIEQELKARLTNGVYGSQASVSDNQEVYRVMLSRALSNQDTRLVYVPADLITYITSEYHSNGIGKSLLEDLQILAGIRAILLFARTMAMLKNSIQSTKVDLTLEPNDPDPQRTINLAIDEVLKAGQNTFPMGLLDPEDLTNWVRRAGYHFSFKGHPGVPETSFDITSNAGVDHKIPDTEFDESIAKQTIMSLGLPPEMVDNAFNSDFATIDLTKNALTAKRFINKGATLMECITDYVRKLIINDETLKEEILSVLANNEKTIKDYLPKEKKDTKSSNTDELNYYLLQEFINNLLVEIPLPESEAFNDRKEAFSAYTDALDEALEFWVGESIMNSPFTGELAEHSEEIKNTYKSYLARKWMADNGYLTEVSELTTKDDTGESSINVEEIMSTHTKQILESVLSYAKKIKEARDKADKDSEVVISDTL